MTHATPSILENPTTFPIVLPGRGPSSPSIAF